MNYADLTPDQKASVDSFMGLYRLSMHRVSAVLTQFSKAVDTADAGALDIIAQIEDGIPNVQGLPSAGDVLASQVIADVEGLRGIGVIYNTDEKRQERVRSGGI
jgi:hypothetical protein